VRAETDNAVLWLAGADVNHYAAQLRRLWSRAARSLSKTTRRYSHHSEIVGLFIVGVFVTYIIVYIV